MERQNTGNREYEEYEEAILIKGLKGKRKYEERNRESYEYSKRKEKRTERNIN